MQNGLHWIEQKVNFRIILQFKFKGVIRIVYITQDFVLGEPSAGRQSYLIQCWLTFIMEMECPFFDWHSGASDQVILISLIRGHKHQSDASSGFCIKSTLISNSFSFPLKNAIWFGLLTSTWSYFIPLFAYWKMKMEASKKTLVSKTNFKSGLKDNWTADREWISEQFRLNVTIYRSSLIKIDGTSCWFGTVDVLVMAADAHWTSEASKLIQMSNN